MPSLTGAIERKYTQAILNLLEAMREQTLSDPSQPSAVAIAAFKPRVADLITGAQQDLTELFGFLQECHSFAARFQSQSPEVRAIVTPILLAELQPKAASSSK